MPYREAPTEAPCHQCERPTRGSCPCCGKPVCDRHLDPKANMCGRCDEAYYRFMHREDAGGAFVQVLAVFAIAIVPALISTSLLPITIATVFLGFPGVLWYRKAGDRRKFFALMKTRGALPEPASKITADDEAIWQYEQKLRMRKLESQGETFTPAPAEKPDL